MDKIMIMRTIERLDGRSIVSFWVWRGDYTEQKRYNTIHEALIAIQHMMNMSVADAYQM